MLTGGHFSAHVMAKAIMRAGWPTLFQDAAMFLKGYDVCLHTKVPIRRDEMPLRPMMGARAFAKWGIDFVGPIHLAAMHILVRLGGKNRALTPILRIVRSRQGHACST